MLHVLLALAPGIAVMIWFFGYGVLINIMLAMLTAVLMEAVVLAIRHKPVISTLNDNSALVSAVLLALSIPPLTQWWIIVVGILFAIVVAKHLYGGLGFNVFNPAMVGYAVLIISFPLQMTIWPDPNLPQLTLSDALYWQFFNQLPPGITLDAITGATPLDALRTTQRMNLGKNNLEHFTVIQPHWWIVNCAWLIGGCWLLFRRIAAWQLPTAFLSSYTILTVFYWWHDTTNHPTPLFYLLHGSVIMAAFFILTDPVTAPMTNNGKIIGAVLIAVLVFVIRNWGGYPEGIAFAVLLMNMAVPLIDRYV